MKKRSFSFISLMLVFFLITVYFPVYAVEPTAPGKYLDNFERASVDGGGTTMSDGTTIYWNGAYDGNFSITNGILHGDLNVGGRYRVGTNNTTAYKYVVLRVKGDSRAVAANADLTVVMGPDGGTTISDASKQVHFNNLLGPDGKVVPAISTEWQDIVIDVQQNGFELGGKDANAFMISAYKECSLDIDYIFMTDENPNAASEVEPTVAGKYLDSFQRATVDGSGTTLSDGTTIYWNGAYDGAFSIANGVLHGDLNIGGRYRVATNNTTTYKYVILRIKGDSRAVAANADITVVMGPDGGVTLDNSSKQVHLNSLLGPDGKVVPAISTEWQDIVIDVQQNGFVLGGKDANAFQIAAYAACALDIEYIFMSDENPNATETNTYDITANYVNESGTQLAASEIAKVDEGNTYRANAKTIEGFTCTGLKVDSAATVAQGTAYIFENVTGNHSVTFVYKANEVTPPTPPAPTDPEDIIDGGIIDNFNRTSLSASNLVLSDGTKIYWNQFGAGTFTVSDGKLHAKMNDGGYYRLATNNTGNYKYVVIRIKGNSAAVNNKIYSRIGVAEQGAIDDNAQRGDKSFAQLLGPDGKSLSAITDQWQNIVIDVSKSGFSLGGGSNAFQIGSWQPMDLDIDFIYMTNKIPNPSTGDHLPITAGAVALAAAAALIVLTRKNGLSEK